MTELQPTSTLLATAERNDSPEVYYGLTIDAWVMAGTLGALFIAVYWVVLRWLWDKTNPIYGEANWGHAICIPIVGLYYLYINRDELLAARVKSTWTGLGITIFGLIVFAYGIWPGQNQFLQGCAMIMAVFGVVLLLCGWDVMKIAYFPIVYLVCGIPWPALVYSWIASPLQELAAKAAVHTLQWTGVNAYRTGTKINMGGITDPVRTLNVAEACAGLRSLMTFITVGAAVAFLSARPLWQKIIITLSAIPIAIFCNVARVAGQGLLDHYVSRQLSEGFAHGFVGMVMLIPAFFLILFVGWILDHIFIEEAELRAANVRRVATPVPAVAAPTRTIAAPVTAPRPTAAAAPAAKTANAPTHSAAPAAAKSAAPAAPAAAPRTAAPVTKAPAPAKAPVPAAPRAPQTPPAATPPRPAPVNRPAQAPAKPAVVPPRPGITPPRPAGVVPPRPRPQPTPPSAPNANHPAQPEGK